MLKRQVQVFANLFRHDIRAVVPLQDVLEVALAQNLWLEAMISELLQVAKRVGRRVLAKHDIMHVAAHPLLYLGSKSDNPMLHALGHAAKQTDGTTRKGRLLLKVGIAEEFVLHKGYSFSFLAGS